MYNNIKKLFVQAARTTGCDLNRIINIDSDFLKTICPFSSAYHQLKFENELIN